jgi:transglutaminase-like putative cysteine protease
MPKFTVHHTTTYTYEGVAYDSANQIMLYPIKDIQQEVLEHQLKITGDPLIDVFTDYYGNEVGTFTNKEFHKELKIESLVIVNVSKKRLPDNSIFHKDQWTSLKNIISIF